MSALLHWFTTPEWTQLVETLLHSLWQGALITVVLALTMRRLTNPLSRYGYSLAALAAIPVAGIITWATLNVPQVPRSAPVTTQPPIEAALDVPVPAQTPDAKLTLQVNRPLTPAQFRWSAWLALAWMIGAIAMLGRAGVKVAGAEQLRRASQPLQNPQIAQLLAEAKRAVGLMCQVRVAVTDRITSPAVVGVIVPTLILPLTLVSTLTPEQIRFILLHELAHIRRGDYFANLFQLFVESLLFFNPAVWWISHQVRREREACCDALAIELSGAPADYARTLVHVAENILNPAPEVAPAFGNEREPSSLADRVQRLLVPGYRPSLRLTWRAMILAFLFGAGLLGLTAEGTRIAMAQISKPSEQTAKEKDAQQSFKVDHDPFREVAFTLSPSPSSVFVEGQPQANQQWFYYRAGFGGKIDNSELRMPSNEHRINQPWFWRRTTTNSPQNIRDRIEEIQREYDHKRRIYELLGAPTTNFQISALSDRGRVDYDFTSGQTIVTNGGIVRFKDFVVRADTIQLDQRNGNLIATGNVRVEHPPGHTNNSARVELNIYSNSPTYHAATAVSPNNGNLTAIIGSDKPSSQVETAERFSIGNPIIVKFAGTIENMLPLEQRIQGDGTITLPLIGTVTAAGKTAVELQKEIHDSYVPVYYKRLTVTVAREQSASLVGGRLRERQSDFTSRVKENQSLGVFSHIHNNQPPTRATVTSERQQLIADRLNQIVLEHVEFNTQPLSNVVRIISTQAKQHDPQGRGVNIIINPPVPSPDEGQAIDIGGLAITINPALTKVRLGDALEAILKGADRPLKMSIEDYAIVISLKGKEPTKLFMREFNLNPAIFLSQLTKLGFRQEDSSATNIFPLASSIRSFFASMGVDVDPTQGRSVFYSDRKGILLVRATKEELDVIEAVLLALNKPEPQVNIKVRFVEVPASLMDSVSKDFLGTNLANLHGWTSILTKPQANEFLKRLQTTQGVGFLSEGEVTTLSGRQAQLQIVDLKQIITGINPLALTPPGITSTNDDVSAAYQMQLIPLGPIIDVIASVSADEDTIQLTATPTFTEFRGYSSTNVGPVYINGQERAAALPLPILCTRQATHNAIVWDGQTAVLGNPAENITFRRSDGKSTSTHIYAAPKAAGTNILLVLVTPTVVDPAGKRPPPSSKATKGGDSESFQTPTNLRPIIDYHAPRLF